MAVMNGEFKVVDLAVAFADTPAGQSDIVSCLLWAFENYGRISPPKEGFTAYDDPEGEAAKALGNLAKTAAEFFGYEVKT